MIPPRFLQDCAFVSIDIQETGPPQPITDEALPADWKQMGFSADDVNEASRFAHEAALPNAVRVAQACRAAGLPMLFVHWGFRFPDGADLDPEVYRVMKANHGDDATQWGGYIGNPGSQPAKAFGIQTGEYVIAKTAQDAFGSSCIAFVLENLGVRRLVMVGGHTGACLGKTARSAKARGYALLCVVDATSDARESARIPNIRDTGYDYLASTQEFLAWCAGAAGE